MHQNLRLDWSHGNIERNQKVGHAEKKKVYIILMSITASNTAVCTSLLHITIGIP